MPARSVAITFDDGYADNYHVALPILKKFGLHATFFVASGYLDGGRMWNDTVIESVRLVKGDTLDLGLIDLGVVDVSTPSHRAAAAQSYIQEIKHKNPGERRRLTERLALEVPGKLPDNLMLTSTELRGLSSEGMEIGGHTISHPILSTLSAREATEEVLGGKKALESILDTEVSLFAYPNGRAGVDYQAKDVEIVRGAGFSNALTTHWGVSDRATDPFQLPRFSPWDETSLKFMARMTSMYRNVVL